MRPFSFEGGHSADFAGFAMTSAIFPIQCGPILSVTRPAMIIEPKKISGFTELLPEERIAELALIDAIRRTYELSGFAPIETPAVERLEVLTSK